MWPDFTFTSVQVTRAVTSSGGAALHTDGKNAGDSLAVGLGDFSGGELWVHGRGALDISGGTWQRFDGRMPHATLPFARGPRYSLIYWTHAGHAALPAAERRLAEQLGFQFPRCDGAGSPAGFQPPRDEGGPPAVTAQPAGPAAPSHALIPGTPHRDYCEREQPAPSLAEQAPRALMAEAMEALLRAGLDSEFLGGARSVGA